jgi:hypothetical protein
MDDDDYWITEIAETPEKDSDYRGNGRLLLIALSAIAVAFWLAIHFGK